MKAIKMRIQKSSRPAVMLMTAVVVIITSVVVANATQTITTPNAAFISYNLAPFANSAPITPVTNRSVLVMGCCTNNTGVAQVSLLHIPSTAMVWVGLESTCGGSCTSVITGGSSGTAGTHIVYIAFQHNVEIQVASADTIQIHNSQPVLTATGNVTLVW